MLVEKLTKKPFKNDVKNYLTSSGLRSERERQADKSVSGVFTGSYAIHPFTKEKVAIWIGEYVLASYGTGAVMAVPCGDQRDWNFANHFNIEILNIFKDIDVSESAHEDKKGTITNSDFLRNSVKILPIIEHKSALACLTSKLPIISTSHWSKDLYLLLPGFSLL